jgi:hypothetical protein
MKRSYKFIDSVERSFIHPKTWRHPPTKILNQICVGMFVKVGVEGEAQGERFWTKVLEIVGDELTVEVDQDMVFTVLHGIKDKDILKVNKFQNIFGVTAQSGEDIWRA